LRQQFQGPLPGSLRTRSVLARSLLRC
jgi:hypothetical protein